MLEKLLTAVREGRPRLAVELTAQALRDGYSVEEILQNSLLPAMENIDPSYSGEEREVARVLAGSRAMKDALEVLETAVDRAAPQRIGRAVLGTAGGDLHDVGKRVLALMFRSAGVEVVDLGVDVPAERFRQAVLDDPDVRIVCISCLVSTSLFQMGNIVRSLRHLRGGKDLYIMVGGGPVTREYAEEIGADIYTENAAEAAEAAARIYRQEMT